MVEFIDTGFPGAKLNTPKTRLQVNQRGSLSGLVAMIDAIPEELLQLGAQQNSEFIISIAVVRNGLRTWEGGDTSLQILSLIAFDDLNPVSLIRRVLSSCPDEMPAPGTVGLEFIEDRELRDNIRLDISAAFKGVADREWKSATVMAGTAVEALLLWALQEHTESVQRTDAVAVLIASGKLNSNPGSDLDRWMLGPFVEVAFHCNLISADTTTQARLTQSFRNLIHPGRATRLGQTCDRGTALSAVAAIEHVSRDLGQL